MIFKKQNLLERIKNYVEITTLKLFWYQWLNKEAQNYLNKEVKSDLKILRRGMKECKFERDRNILFQHFVEKYQEKYCPSAFYKYFSNKNKLEYMALRIEIDNVLSKKDQIFSDFLIFNEEVNYN
ncbi:hypothetical protein HYS72_03130 [Candidatus Pacearchaeota archaeon]|nr:hypothetical protein [Candidatus Pacearchaeota archaeon]